MQVPKAASTGFVRRLLPLHLSWAGAVSKLAIGYQHTMLRTAMPPPRNKTELEEIIPTHSSKKIVLCCIAFKTYKIGKKKL